MARCWASFLSCFGAFLRIKPPVCRLLFFAIMTRCPLFVVATVRFQKKKRGNILGRRKKPERGRGGGGRERGACGAGFGISMEGREGGGGGGGLAAGAALGLCPPLLLKKRGVCSTSRRGRGGRALLNPLFEVKAHGFCIGNPEPAHPVTLAGNPVLAGDSAKRGKQILVGNRGRFT